MIKSVDDSPGNNLNKIKNLNGNPKLERSEKYGGSNNKLNNKNILNNSFKKDNNNVNYILNYHNIKNKI